MRDFHSFWKKCVNNGTITPREYNDGLEAYIVYRICWENHSHLVIMTFHSEESATSYCDRLNQGMAEPQYFYGLVKLN